MDGASPTSPSEQRSAPSNAAGPLDASVVICAYTERRWDDLCAAVHSVRIQEPSPREIVLVIDHAPELAVRARIELEGDDLRVIDNAGRQGLSGGRNTGIAATTGSVVVFLDDDAVAEPGWLAALTAPFTDPTVAAVGGPAGAVFDHGRPGWFPAEFDWVVGCTYVGHPTTAVEIRNPIGCNMAIRRDALDAAGDFREEMGRIGTRPLGCEETELCIRLRQNDPRARIVFAPDARVTQRVPAERATFGYFRSRCYAEGLSKAMVARLVGSGDGLASERGYTTRTLPAGVARGLADVVRRPRLDGPRRALAIVCGLVVTTVGYLRGRLDGGDR